MIDKVDQAQNVHKVRELHEDVHNLIHQEAEREGPQEIDTDSTLLNNFVQPDAVENMHNMNLLKERLESLENYMRDFENRITALEHKVAILESERQ